MDASTALQAARLGETGGEIALEGHDVIHQAILALVQQACDRVLILSPRLDTRLFGSRELASILSSLLRAHRRAHGRILVQDAAALAREGHPLLDLARRLSSHLEIRRLPEEQAALGETWVLVDEAGLMRMPHPERYAGTACFHAPQAVRELTQEFAALWEAAGPDPNLRRLHL